MLFTLLSLWHFTCLVMAKMMQKFNPRGHYVNVSKWEWSQCTWKRKSLCMQLILFFCCCFFYLSLHLIGTHVPWVWFINLILYINKNSVSFMQECSLVMYLLIWTKNHVKCQGLRRAFCFKKKYSGLGNSDCSIGQLLTIWDVSFQIISTPTPSLKFDYSESWVSFGSHAFL